MNNEYRLTENIKQGLRSLSLHVPINMVCGITSIPSQWEVSCSIAYSPWYFVPRMHVPGQLQGLGWIMSLRNNSLMKWIGVTSSAHFMDSLGYGNATQSDAAVTAGALSVHPSHISK